MKSYQSAIAMAAMTVCTLAAAPAHAALTFGSIPNGASNEFIGTFFPGQKIEGYYGAQLYLVGGPATITAQYFGAEAGFTNTFTYTTGPGTCNNATTFTHTGGGGHSFLDNAAAGLGATDSGREGQVDCTAFQAANSLLNFNFKANSGASTVTNGSNPDNTGTGANFFVSFDTPAYGLDINGNGSTPGGGQSVFLFLDDGGAGVGGDDNHDDMVVRLSITCAAGFNCGFQIPEPGSLALVGLALLGAGASRRRMS